MYLTFCFIDFMVEPSDYEYNVELFWSCLLVHAGRRTIFLVVVTVTVKTCRTQRVYLQWQNCPVNISVHLHLKVAPASLQTPSFSHGISAQSSSGTEFPCNKGLCKVNKNPKMQKKTWIELTQPTHPHPNFFG